MEKQNYLLPFAFTKTSSFNESDILNKTPRDKSEIDDNAGSFYHTRKTIKVDDKLKNRPKLNLNPLSMKSLKRRMGESFNDKDDVKKVDFGDDGIVQNGESNEHMNSEDSYDEEPTFIDEEENNDNGGQTLPPSSPIGSTYNGIELMSEFDFNTNPTTSFQVPKSPPKKIYNLHSDQLKTSPQKPISSDTDFGIDRFNRYRGSFNDNNNNLPTSSSIDEDFVNLREVNKQISYNKARNIIIDAFENTKTIIDLRSMNLSEIPDEIKDLNNLVIFDSFTEEASIEFPYQLYLNGNKLTQLPMSLFKFTKLQVLSLRQNKLISLPPSINKLKNLIDFSISSNKLKFLPFQILELQNLSNFTSGPNPFLSLPSDAIPINSKSFINSKIQPRARSEVSYFNIKQSTLTSLKSLCLNKIAKYDVSYQETKEWKKHTPKIYHNLIIKAITKGKFNDKCSQCDIIVVEPVAEIYEWWDILQNKNIPIRKQFCCQRCVNKYLIQEYIQV
ncbi:uncharacterized protein KGF55_004467 [Candida pseudojiufengensis]|uniref:uncharacterized protein n=1 Tax=Candida pseudojiufengensis TaxID=497109 RepID=UPI0022243E55|nr:uncharacterized protein KGF55_004467 [Candida pseudojiufengensis]KAI5960574.1 hypothetical protein KGF55_004467 [Candida pseudojiufengensis]